VQFVNAPILALILLVLLGLAYSFGWGRAKALAGSGTGLSAKVHSRTQYHAARVALFAVVPAILVVALSVWIVPGITRSFVLAQIPADVSASVDPAALNTIVGRINAIASGFGVVGTVEPYEQAAGESLRQFQLYSLLLLIAATAGVGVMGMWFALQRMSPRMRARNHVESVVKYALMACSAVAILTTVGIVASLVTEAFRFFTFVSPIDFFFGTVWSPRFSSTGTGDAGQFGLLPLLSGTLLVAGVAMLVAVPVGLMTAIYLSQYAHPKVRAVVKPVIEVLAGIPTIVYGFFALVTVGPFLRDAGALVGLQVSATSALTAGIVMGIMIIPFISSLSDDILNQVPRTLRDGAYGLGATQSETIRQVLLPAALPGIVGAFLLAVSRAIGETMIVVLAAGNSPVLRGNPLEPVSTITVSIVNQLTGDTDFTGPQSLVGFALGLTLFVMTLFLNIAALYIVRRFREQYE